jgi:hypothetical protein
MCPITKFGIIAHVLPLITHVLPLIAHVLPLTAHGSRLIAHVLASLLILISNIFMWSVADQHHGMKM